MAKKKMKDEVRFESVEMLSNAKTMAESRVKLFRSLLEDGQVEDKVYRKIQVLYDDARSDVNAGLDRVLVELETKGTKGTVERYDNVARRAAERAAKFTEAIDEVVFGKDRGLEVIGVDLIEPLAKAFVDVWKVLHGEKTQRHVLLMQRITSLKWAEFSDIK